MRVFKNTPTPGDVHVNAPLTNISVAYVQSQDNFIADRVFPVLPVEKQTDLYYLYNKGDFLRDEARKRAPSTESAGGGFDLTTASYRCEPEAFHKDIDDQTRANADSVLSLDTAATQYVTQKLLIRRERQFVTNFFGSGIWGTDVTGVASGPTAGQFLRWDVSTSTPLANVEAGKRAILGATGFIANTMVVSYEVFSALRDNAAIRDQFKYTSADSIDEAMMARYFGVDRFLIFKSIYSSGIEGGTQTTGFIAGKHALLCYSAPSPSLMMPTAGYTFTWSGYTGAGAYGIRMSKWREQKLRSDRIEGEMAYDMKKIAAECGYMFNSAIS
jgi:hypothetical protein